MKEWQIRHKIFHQVFKGTDLGDDLSKETIIEDFSKEKIIKKALEYPLIQTRELYYPAKSYAVGIIFAKLLEHYFEEDFLECLNNDKLLYENDPYFVVYSKDKETYDEIIKSFPFELLAKKEKCSQNLLKTIEYFEKEFLIHDDTKMLLPS